MDKLIPVTNQIRDALSSARLDLGVDLPQIAVVGGQSVGKSSLLEALVGKAFLPTGAGVVTRRPLILQLVHRSEDNSEWGEFAHLPGQRFENFDDIRLEIVRETERVCGNEKVISPKPIVLQVTSPRLITLSLVDLPGIARLPVGNQPEDIEHQIRQLIMAHISKPGCLILAVAAANADLATADSLALAREVDPTGERTLGVLTKIDLAEHAAAECAAVLEGKVYPLKLGFVGVTCRSFRDVQMSKDIKDQMKEEELFFKNHAIYKGVSQQCGVRHLARQLNWVLLEKICETLPSIRTQALQQVQDVESELQGYGEPVEKRSKREQGALLLSLFAKFAGRFGDAVEGKCSSQPLEVPGPMGQLIGRARIDYIFRDVFARTVQEFNSFSGLSDEEIRVAIRNATGPRATLFVPEAAFELLVRRQVAKLQAPSLQCADLVFDELQRVLLLSELPEFKRFARLREQVFAVVRDILRRCLEPTTQMIRDLISIEMAYINTSHPDFLGSSGAFRSATSAASPSAACQGEAPHVEASEAANGRPKEAGRERTYSGGITNLLHPPGSSGEQLRAESPLATDVARSASASSIFANWGNPFAGRRSTSAGRVPAQQNTSEVVASPMAMLHPDPLVGANGSSTSSTAPAPTALFPGGGPKLPHVSQSINPAATAPEKRERVEVTIIKNLMENYLTLVKKNVADSVPKAIMLFLVGGAGVAGSDPSGEVSSLKDAIQSECVTRLYKEDIFDQLLSEGADVQGRRVACRERLEAMRKVVEVTDHVRDVLDSL